MHVNDVIKFLIENKDVFITFIVSLVAVIKLTAWGKGQSAALDAVIGVIEQIGAKDVKTAIASASTDLSSSAQDAVADSVAKADPKKTTTSLLVRLARELFRVK